MYMHISTLPGQAVAAIVAIHGQGPQAPLGGTAAVDIRIIAEALGHESLESTQIDTQVSFQRTRKISKLFCSPEESFNPEQNGQRTQLVPTGLHFQK